MSTPPERPGLRNDMRGTATVEFVILAPMLFAFMFALVEAGWLMSRSMMLERALDLTVRELRLGHIGALSHTELKSRICAKMPMLRNCTRTMLIELAPVRTAADVPQIPVCRDRTQPNPPAVNFRPGHETEITFVRACVIVDPLMPGIGLGLRLPKDASGGRALMATSAYVSEPL